MTSYNQHKTIQMIYYYFTYIFINNCKYKVTLNYNQTKNSQTGKVIATVNFTLTANGRTMK